MHINRYFTSDTDSFTSVMALAEWSKREAKIVKADGTIVFYQEVKFPTFYSDTAVNIISSKYLKVINGQQEQGLRELLERVVSTFAEWGIEHEYFKLDSPDYFAFTSELGYILLFQKACFNSPVWFNIGVPNRDPQVSACFLLDVEDNMDDILRHGMAEGRIFKGGSGAGVNVSKLRAKGESLSAGGTSSGPLSFMKGWDKMAGAIKSGGTTRRAAKMIIMDADHPDIEEFISSKVNEEKKALVLSEAGYDSGIDGESYETVAYQNENHSVSVTNEFMQMATDHTYLDKWQIMGRVDENETKDVVSAKEMLEHICEAAWKCGDPGLFFKGTINNWNATRTAGEIITSNPCGEFLHQPFTSCNLSSINLRKFEEDNNSFNWGAFEHTVEIMTIAQDISICGASFPLGNINKATKDYRPIGIGFTNLGGFLMAMGIPYDSGAGRRWASEISAVMTGIAYKTSADLAKHLGAFPEYDKVEPSISDVIYKHIDKVSDYRLRPSTLELWKKVDMLRRIHGFRNSYVTNIAPTGTISFFMDADTTGIEPELSLLKYKQLVGGGTVQTVNKTAIIGLKSMGYDDESTKEMKAIIEEGESLVSHMEMYYNDDHLVFLTALDDVDGNALMPEAHIDMVAAVTPFISGGVSKTVNCPEDYTPKDIFNLYKRAWEQGCKSITVYRNNSKISQPMVAKKEATIKIDIMLDNKLVDEVSNQLDKLMPDIAGPIRHKLPDNVVSHRHKFVVGMSEGYIHVGEYENGQPGEVFITMMKENSTIDGLMKVIGILTSYGLQYGVPLDKMCEKISGIAFEPSGFTGNEDIRQAKSITDYVYRYLFNRYSSKELDVNVPEPSKPEKVEKTTKKFLGQLCQECWSPVIPTGNCYTCTQCGSQGGCG